MEEKGEGERNKKQRTRNKKKKLETINEKDGRKKKKIYTCGVTVACQPTTTQCLHQFTPKQTDETINHFFFAFSPPLTIQKSAVHSFFCPLPTNMAKKCMWGAEGSKKNKKKCFFWCFLVLLFAIFW